MRFLLALVLFLPGMVFAQSAGQNIGQSLISENDVSLRYAGSLSNLAVGDPVVFGGVIQTGDNSANVDRFLDDSRLTIAPNSTVDVDRFVYQEASSSGEVAVGLIKGALRFVSGRMPSQSYKLNTRYAVLGTRGTRFVLTHNDSDGTTVIVEEGAVDFSNGRGANVEVGVGQFSRIDRLGGEPSEPADIGSAEAAAVANVNTAVAISAPPSVSMPGVVGDLSANAAAASAASASAAATSSSEDFGGDGRY